MMSNIQIGLRLRQAGRPIFGSQNVRLRRADQFDLPDEYARAIQDAQSRLEGVFAARLLMMLVSGSCATNTAVAGWSDLDLVIALDTCSSAELLAAGEALAKSPVRVGASVYSRTDLESVRLDNKSLRSLFYVQNQGPQPTVWATDLSIPTITRTACVERDRWKQADAISRCRDEVLRPNRDRDPKRMLKAVALVIRMDLFRRGIDVFGYQQLFAAASERLAMPRFDPMPVLHGGVRNSQELWLFAADVICDSTRWER